MTWNNFIKDTLLMIIFICAIIFLGISLLINTGRSCDTTTNFLVLEDANLTNQSLSILYFDCVKFCSDRYAGQGISSTTNCYNQCDKIGGIV